jgi:peroxiredoxin Q/BCP
MLEIGSRAPEFTLPLHTGGEISLTTMLNHGPLLLYFYAADFAPTCGRQATAIAAIHGQLRADGINVVGLSPQPPASHQRFRRRLKLPQALLSDRNKAVIRMYDVLGPLGVVRRATYLIDQGRVICNAVLAEFRSSVHTDCMLDARPLLDALARYAWRPVAA